VHQLHLQEVAVALIVFDVKSEVDPFAGIRYWARALRQAGRLQAPGSGAPKALLVAARLDRGGLDVSRERIEALVQELGFDGYVETSAKEGLNIPELQKTIRQAIRWDDLPKVRSTDLFQALRAFVLREKERGRLLSNAGDLLAKFMDGAFEGTTGADMLRRSVSETDKDAVEVMQRAFMTCIGRLESSGLVRRLSFGNLVLLQPELLDAYASAMVNTARSEPDGLGSLLADDALLGRFAIAVDERITDKEEERLLLIATVEDLIRHEIALKEQADDGPHLVFPSQLTRDISAATEAADKELVLSFQGAVLNVYATLVVRLSYSGWFKKRQMWKNGVAFEVAPQGQCSVVLREPEEGAGELGISYADDTGAETRAHFEHYVTAHLEKRAVAGSVQRKDIQRCRGCRTPISDLQAERRKSRGFDWISCPVCDERVSLLVENRRAPDRPEARVVASLDRRADAARDFSAASLVVSGKRSVGEFDVFLCHNSRDKDAVKDMGRRLQEHGVLPWLDEWELRPGLPWQRALEEQILRINAAAVFVGASGLGPWQEPELDAFLRQFVQRRCPVIPVLLPDAPSQPALPVFLQAMTWVDCRKIDPDPFHRLIWGITGERATGDHDIRRRT
jgi:nucleotide-binding universal stress UspA family protein